MCHMRRVITCRLSIKNVTRTLHSILTFKLKYHISYIKSVYIKGMAKKNKKENKKGGTDPKAAALAFLNINLGSKNIRTLKKEEVHAAFVKQLHISETT